MKLALLAATAASGLVVSSVPARADDADQRIKSIEQQIQALQNELHRVRHDLSARDAQVRDAQAQAARAKQESENARAVALQAQARSLYPQTTANPLLPAPGAPAGAPPASMGYVTFPKGRPTLTSADGKYSFSIGLQFQYDFGGFASTNHGVPTILNSSGTPTQNTRLTPFSQNLRRMRIPLTFKAGDFVINVTPDFGNSLDGATRLYEANFNYVGLKPFTFTAGYFKPWLTLADAASSNDFLFLERPSIMEIARNIAGGDARGSFGASANGNRWFVASYLTTSSWGNQNNYGTAVYYNSEQMGGTFRIAGRPVATKNVDLHLGFSGSDVWQLNRGYGTASPTFQLRDWPELRLDNNRILDTGALPASDVYEFGPEFGLRYRNFLLEGEWVQIGVNRSDIQSSTPLPDLTFDGGYVEASWVLTGETRKYNPAAAAFTRPNPAHSVLDGGWGAFELAARYSVADLNDDVTPNVSTAKTGGARGGRQQVESFSLSWYPTNNLRAILDYEILGIDKIDSTGKTQIGENAQAVAVRLQAAF
ncbi:MAG TPA: porin [Acetobacteraceae bacterium]|nr:porin [Acetobacteraceae bacterium]